MALSYTKSERFTASPGTRRNPARLIRTLEAFLVFVELWIICKVIESHNLIFSVKRTELCRFGLHEKHLFYYQT